MWAAHHHPIPAVCVAVNPMQQAERGSEDVHTSYPLFAHRLAPKLHPPPCVQLAEREGDDGETRYLVKWAGFEADPTDDSWLEEGDLSDVSGGWGNITVMWCFAIRLKAGTRGRKRATNGAFLVRC